MEIKIDTDKFSFKNGEILVDVDFNEILEAANKIDKTAVLNAIEEQFISAYGVLEEMHLAEMDDVEQHAKDFLDDYGTEKI